MVECHLIFILLFVILLRILLSSVHLPFFFSFQCLVVLESSSSGLGIM